ncbi:MAG: beta-propeller fold lactonase family protein [Alphaproteobacteria bacterium]
MIDRRTFTAGLAGAVAAPHSARSQTTPKTSFFYVSQGPSLTGYAMDAEAATLTRHSTALLPANVQYAWPHPSAPFLYVATSNGGSAALGIKGDKHDLTALRIEPETGALKEHGASVSLPTRPIHVTIDHSGAYALAAYNNPSSVTVHRINADGTLGAEIKQATTLDCGVFAHQVRVTPANDAAILVCRGNDANQNKPEDPGSLREFTFRDGQLANRTMVAPNGGYGFGPRHLDFHPNLPFVYVSRERENKLNVYRTNNGVLDQQLLFEKDTLADPGHIVSRQAACTLHFHPNGRFLYLANRAYDTVKMDGKDVFPGGENSIAVYAIDQATGEPTLIQSEDVHGIYPRTFALDPGARMLAVTNMEPKLVRDGAGLKTVPANIATFRVGADGKLSFARSYEVDTRGQSQFWSGLVAIG